jgi:hypothetical protein
MKYDVILYDANSKNNVNEKLIIYCLLVLFLSITKW